MANTAITYTERKRENTRCGILPETVSFSIREPGSALTHFAGLLLFLIAAAPLLSRARIYGSVWTVAGMWIYVAATCMLYAASTMYHTVVADLKTTTFFRKLDHCSISVMIAGTYTPICLTLLRGTAGTALLIAVWSLALISIVLKLAWITCPKWVSSVIYVGMGWLCMFAIRPIIEKLTVYPFLWLLAGGIFYTIGAVIYAMHPEKFDEKHIYFGSHEIFHVFIMLGTFCQYIFLYRWIACIM